MRREMNFYEHLTKGIVSVSPVEAGVISEQGLRAKSGAELLMERVGYSFI